jgi:hypothetical protein
MRRKKDIPGSLVALILNLSLAIVLAACGGTSEDSGSGDGTGGGDSGSTENSVLPTKYSVPLPASVQNTTSSRAVSARDENSDFVYSYISQYVSLAKAPLVEAAMLFSVADKVITDYSLSPSDVAVDRTLKVTSALVKRMEAIAKGAGLVADLSEYADQSIALKSFKYAALSGDADYAYEVSFAWETADTISIYWSADKTKVKFSVASTAIDEESSLAASENDLVYDASVPSSSFAVYQKDLEGEETYLHIKVLGDSASSNNAAYIGIFDDNSDLSLLIYADDLGGAAQIAGMNIAFDANGTTVSSGEAYTAKLANASSNLASVSSITASLVASNPSQQIIADVEQNASSAEILYADTNLVAKATPYKVGLRQSYASYEWLLDDVELSGITVSSDTSGVEAIYTAAIPSSSLVVGRTYRLTLIATDSSGDEYSSSLCFTVTE